MAEQKDERTGETLLRVLSELAEDYDRQRKAINDANAKITELIEELQAEIAKLDEYEQEEDRK